MSWILANLGGLKRKDMKKTFFLSLVALLGLCQGMAATELTDMLAKITAIGDVKALADSAGYSEKYVMTFTHPIDYDNPSLGSFTQRIVLMHQGFDRPTVVVTEGYWADYAMNPRYREELSSFFNTNVVFCEYRYFGPSTPAGCDWRHMTVENSLCDLHEVVTALKSVYKGKWVATGISKGGTTTMCYRAYFPDDVDVSVPYVAPLTRALEDGRHEPFIAETAGTPALRKVVHDEQMWYLGKKSELLPLFEARCKEKGYTFRVPVSDIYDYWVLEYSFAFFQWGMDPAQQAPHDASLDKVIDWMFAFNDPSYFSKQTPYVPFNYQASREIGYYGYDTKPFAPYMQNLDTHDYMRRLMLPDSLAQTKFDDTLYKTVSKYLKKNDPKMLYIYGEWDPWTASGVYPWLDVSHKKNLQIWVQPMGSHRSRIGNMPPLMREQIVKQLSEWLGVEPVEHEGGR